MPGTEGNTDVSDVPVEPLDEVGRRRQLKAAMTGEHSTREERGSSAFDTGYEFTLDLADTAVNLPEEELNPNVDEILHRYEASPAEPSAVASSETVADPDADEILAAISTHHGKSQPRGPRPAPRGSADLSPAAPKIKRRIFLTPPPLRLRSRAHARTALAAHEPMGAPVTSASRRSNPRRSRVVVAVLAVAAVASAAMVVSLSGKSAKVPSNTTASRLSVVQQTLIGTNAGTGLLFHFLPRREFAWVAPLVLPKTKSRTPSKTETRRTKAPTRSSHHVTVKVTRPENDSAPTNSSQTTATNSTHSSQSSSPRTSATGSSAGCQGAGVMAPTNCGKPSL